LSRPALSVVAVADGRIYRASSRASARSEPDHSAKGHWPGASRVWPAEMGSLTFLDPSLNIVNGLCETSRSADVISRGPERGWETG